MSGSCCPAPVRVQGPRWEVADVFRSYGEAYRRRHDLPGSVLAVMKAIETCRTAALGGHIERCDACGFERPAYNSCRNRHCPKCQAIAKARWLEARRGELLPVEYFHTVFTLPHQLNPLILANKRTAYDILFRAASETLQHFARDPKDGLGGRLGFTAVLHTWDQKLLDHTHLHCIIPGGALSADGQRWTPARDGFLFPVKAVSELFRAKFTACLQKAFQAGRLRFPAKAAHLATPDGFGRLLTQLANTPWVVYTKASFPGPASVLDYLARYTHRVAISNHRITNVAGGLVSFTYRDRKANGATKTLTLPAEEFIRRFLLHVLPRGYTRIRHFGFLASRSKAKHLQRCRQLLAPPPQPPTDPPMPATQLLAQLTDTDPSLCPQCQRGTMHPHTRIPRQSPNNPNPSPHIPAIQDSS